MPNLRQTPAVAPASSPKLGHTAVLCAFDLIEIDGKDLRRAPIEERKHVLAGVNALGYSSQAGA